MANVNFNDIEKKFSKYWEKEKIYKFNSKSNKKVYSIDVPPPNISGKMHIGHAFSYSHMDFIARFKRMKIGSVFYPFGTDDNGLPTERLVEKTKKIRSIDMSRAEFVKLCLNFLKIYTPEAIEDWKRLGISCDYDINYSTINAQAQKISQQSFLDLVKKGYVYKDNFPTIWCPHCQTSIAQAELEDKTFESKFSTLKFICEGKNLLVSTTRPELLGACVAVFVNPKDKRYLKLIGKRATVPLFNQDVPIIEDESAKIDKGTGVLMVCSYGDRFDLDAINRHKLNSRIIIEKDGTLNIGKYSGMKIKDARKKILEDLKEANLIEETKEITHIVNVHDKCGTEIEIVNTPQWFIKIIDKKQEFIEQGRKIKWHPEFMRKRYENWINGLEWDWSISRNRHFGVPIPAWECEKCEELIFPSEKELPIDPLQVKRKCPICGDFAIPEKMVLDTWATSSVTPQIASNLVGNKIKIPFDLRPQGHDIIRTWAFYTIVKSYFSEKKIPWKNIMISGNVSLGGEKMSKTKGNVVDPQKVIDNYSADALRFWAASANLGNDLDYQEKDLITGKKLINKILNASKFIFMNMQNYPNKKPKKLEKIDELFLTKLGLLVEEVTEAFEKYEYAKAKQALENFFWKVFCDNYLEIIKKRIYSGNSEEKLSAQYSLYSGFLILLKLFAPIIPFVTEEVYFENYLKNEKTKSIHLCKWPIVEFNSQKLRDEVYKLERLIKILEKIRKEKSEANKSMNTEIALSLEKEDFEIFGEFMKDLKNVTNAVNIEVGKFKVEFFGEKK